METGFMRRYINLKGSNEDYSSKGRVDNFKENELGVKSHISRDSDLGSFIGFMCIASIFVIATLGFVKLFAKLIRFIIIGFMKLLR